MQRLFYFLALFLFIFTYSALSQPPDQIDVVVRKIYNLEFEDVENRLESLNMTEPQIGGYLKFDCLWWKMISDKSATSEAEFVNYINAFQDKINGGDKDFNRLIYYLYQVRYDSYKNISLSKYWTALKCQVFIQKIKDGKEANLRPLERAIFQLIVEFDKCLKYSLIDEFNVFSTINEKKIHLSLDKIEKIDNGNYSSFLTIKNYFLGKIYLEIVHDSIKAHKKFSILSEEFPDNVVLKEIKSKCISNHSIDG